MWSGAVYRNPWEAFQDGGAYGMVAYTGTEQELLDRVASLRAASQFRNFALYWVLENKRNHESVWQRLVWQHLPEHCAASNQQTLHAFVCMEFTFVPYEPGAEQPKKSNKPKKTPLSTTAPASAVDALPANSSTSTPTVTDIAAPEAAPGIDLTAPAPTSVLGPPPSAPSPPVLHTNTRPVPSSSVLNDVNMYGSSSSEDSDNDRDDDDSNDEGTSKKKKHKKDDFVEIPQDGVPSGQAGVESWHGCNPDHPAIPLRNHRPKQNVETLETARLKREANKQTAAKLTDAIQNIEVAEAHNVKVELVLRRLMSLGSMKASRKISLFNAKVHHLCKRQKLIGRPIKLKEARRRVRLDPEWEDMDEEAEQALRDELMQHRELKKHGARATPTACMVDARFTTESIAQEMTALAERTGMIGFGFFTRTHIHNKTVPVEIESWGALEFFSQVLRMDPRDVGAKFELWAIACDKGKSTLIDVGVLEQDTLRSMQKEVVQYHEEGIRAKGRKNLRLNWKQYWTVMVVKHRLILRGWPLHDRGPCNPKLIHTIESIREVRDALKDGSCFWHRLMDPEWEREKAKVEQMLEDGDIEATKRKVRSDKNTKKRRESPEREPQATRSRANKSKARRVWNEESEEETEKETEMVKAKKHSRAEGDDRNRDEPPKKKKRTSKSSKSASDNPDRFQEMQKKL
ncbi:hypothetical protein C8F04DRAFT_1182412 [Mycena alexandri]|uniref:Uncharacterized protein n=1 Tax=Mycena alexandri TaxID=1745969 RepID=A0AAD6SYM3_9AGAR|nr:hypothetical protein C8F04DRAFT_1182412 [Mycena alexandri]